MTWRGYDIEIQKIKGACPALALALSDKEIEDLWSDFSTDTCDAGFLIVDADYLRSFSNWLPDYVRRRQKK